MLCDLCRWIEILEEIAPKYFLHVFLWITNEHLANQELEFAAFLMKGVLVSKILSDSQNYRPEIYYFGVILGNYLPTLVPK